MSTPLRRWCRSQAADSTRDIDAEQLPFEREFDAVFSNAALHWVRDHDAMLTGVHRALKPGGRFVAEFGGHGNIAAIQVAIRSVLAHRGWETNIHRYYATPAEYSARLETHGFSVSHIELIPRPTPLPTGIRGWLETFERATLDRVPLTSARRFWRTWRTCSERKSATRTATGPHTTCDYASLRRLIPDLC